MIITVSSAFTTAATATTTTFREDVGAVGILLYGGESSKCLIVFVSPILPNPIDILKDELLNIDEMRCVYILLLTRIEITGFTGVVKASHAQSK